MAKPKPPLKRLVIMDACCGAVYVVDLTPRQSSQRALENAAVKFKMNLSDCHWMVTNQRIKFYHAGDK